MEKFLYDASEEQSVNDRLFEALKYALSQDQRLILICTTQEAEPAQPFNVRADRRDEDEKGDNGPMVSAKFCTKNLNEVDIVEAFVHTLKQLFNLTGEDASNLADHMIRCIAKGRPHIEEVDTPQDKMLRNVLGRAIDKGLRGPDKHNN